VPGHSHFSQASELEQ
jgi:hypothetical protein